MINSIGRKTGTALIAATLGLSATPTALAQDYQSGFLRDYSSLQQTTDASGKPIRAWASPKLTPANFNAIMIDPLVFYPEPKPSERVSAAALQQILKYANDTLRQSLGKRFKVVDQPGKGVLRLRAAFTSVAAKAEGLKPYQMIPLAFLATMAKRAASGDPQNVFIVVEVEGTDSATGELMAERIRVGTGEKMPQIGEKDPITLAVVKPLLDDLAAGALPDLEKYVKAK